jgi:hypothetical protein
MGNSQDQRLEDVTGKIAFPIPRHDDDGYISRFAILEELFETRIELDV